jgi:hypothetical protein
MNKKLPLVFCVYSLASICHAQVVGGEYIHIPENRPVIGFFPSANTITIGDIAHEAKFCPGDSDYVCFEVKELKFATPRNPKDMKSWIYDGERYKVTRRFSTRESHPAWVIEKITGLKMWFLWSSHNGLMMFAENRDKNQSGVYMSDGFCGFAASKGCESLLKK